MGLNGLLGRVAASLRQRGGGDGELLDLFVTERDEGAFEALLVRHGPMVLGVCRRVLGDRHDAEDAFQATFLVLARKASSVRPQNKVGNWLYGVALRTALHARKSAALRRKKEARAIPRQVEEGAAAGGLREVLDQELSRLSPSHREVIVLCDLEGRSHKEIAGLLGCPEGTVASRLSRARAALAARLSRHGSLLAGLPTASVPAVLAGSTVRAASAFAGGCDVAGAVPARTVALAEEVLRAMFTSKLTRAALFLLVALLAAGAGLASVGKASRPPDEQPQAKEGAPKTAEKEVAGGDLKKLQGMWVKQTSPRQVWVVSGEKLTIYGTPQEFSHPVAVKIDAAKRPKAIDLTSDGSRQQGVYEVEGDTLTLVMATSGKPRPTGLKAGQEEALHVLKRQPFKDGARPAVTLDVDRAYRENEALADEFTGKRMAVLGLVDLVKRHGTGYALALRTKGDSPLLFEFATDSRKDLAVLERGQLVIVEGRCRGREKAGPGKEVIAFSSGKVIKAVSQNSAD